MLQMVAAGRGIAALPLWLVKNYAQNIPIKSIRLGKKGIQKKIYLGTRASDHQEDYLEDFVNTARLQKL